MVLEAFQMKWAVYKSVCPDGAAKLYDRTARQNAGECLRTGNAIYRDLALKDARTAGDLRERASARNEKEITDLLNLGE